MLSCFRTQKHQEGIWLSLLWKRCVNVNDRELLEYIAAQVGKLTQNVGELQAGQKDADIRLDRIENIVTRIENDHGEKLEALLDGYKQNAEKIDRIEKEVSKQEEIIMRRVK